MLVSCPALAGEKEILLVFQFRVITAGEVAIEPFLSTRFPSAVLAAIVNVGRFAG